MAWGAFAYALQAQAAALAVAEHMRRPCAACGPPPGQACDALHPAHAPAGPQAALVEDGRGGGWRHF